MNFEASRTDKYIYYGEWILTRGLVLVLVLGLAVLFWDGWVQGTEQFLSARKTVEICDQGHASIRESEDLRKACHAAKLVQSVWPTFFALKFTLYTLVDGFISAICLIGASWLTSSVMGLAFALLMAYVYRRINGPPNPYAYHYGGGGGGFSTPFLVHPGGGHHNDLAMHTAAIEYKSSSCDPLLSSLRTSAQGVPVSPRISLVDEPTWMNKKWE